jgi:hypothetical protein
MSAYRSSVDDSSQLTMHTNQVVFWTNSEDTLPCGSVADKSTKDNPKGGIKENGSGNEIIE